MISMRRFLFTGVLFAFQLFFISHLAFSNSNSRIITNDTIDVNQRLKNYFNLIETDSINARLNLEIALKISKDIGFSAGIAESSSYLGTYYLDRFNLLKAQNYFEEALQASKKTGNKLLTAKTSNNLGTIFEKKGSYSEAISDYLYAYELFDSLNNESGISAITNNIGAIYYLLNEPKKAKNFFRISMQFKKRIGDSLSLIYIYQNLGNVYYDLWAYDSAKYYYNKCIDLSLGVNDQVSAGIAYNGLGFIAMTEKNVQLAKELFGRALYYSSEKNDYRNISSTYDNLGLLDYYSGNIDSAIYNFTKSLNISQQFGLREEMKNAYQHLSDSYSKSGNYESAYINLLNYINLQSELLTEKNSVSGIETLFLKQKQENKILELEKEKEKRKAQLTLILAFITILIISSVLLFNIYRIAQKSKHNNKIAALEKERFKSVIEAQELERKRIAEDLHDSVGQMLSLSKLQLSELLDYSGDIEEEQRQILRQSANIIDDACEEVRNISHNLMPGALIRSGLFSAVRDLIRKINAAGKINAILKNNVGNIRFSETLEISLFRIIQEIMNNTIKHSKASEIILTFNRNSDKGIDVSIHDNGIGFEPERIKYSQGIGWKNIYSRLAIINGSMNIKSIKDKGTDIYINIFL